MSVELVKIDLLGCSFSIQTDESKEYMQAILAELEHRIETLRGSTKVSDPLKLSILANITLLDELANARKSAEDPGTEELGRVAEKLILQIDQSLADKAESEAASSRAQTADAQSCAAAGPSGQDSADSGSVPAD